MTSDFAPSFEALKTEEQVLLRAISFTEREETGEITFCPPNKPAVIRRELKRQRLRLRHVQKLIQRMDVGA